VTLFERIGAWVARLRGRSTPSAEKPAAVKSKPEPVGTYIQKLDAAWLRSKLTGKMDVQIGVWRSVSVRFLRAVIHTALGGRYWLRLLYALEERFPGWFGENGQYPLIVISKPV